MNRERTTIECLDLLQLSACDIAAWSRLQESNPSLRSPFFRPEFGLVVANVLPRNQVAVMRREGEPIAFWPFERLSKHRAGPLGGMMSDYQGIIAAPDTEFDARAILRACGLRGYEFDHLLVGQTSLSRFKGSVSESRFIDVGGGLEGYVARRGSTSEDYRRGLQKHRKALREYSTIELQLDDRSEEAFRRLVSWKSEQFQQTGASNIFSRSCTVSLLSALREQRSAAFAGMVSSLRIGGDLAAVSYFLRSGLVLHGWVSAYNRAYSRHSPGILLLLELIKRADELGISMVDLGKGDEPYKIHFMTGSCLLAEGSIETSGAVTVARRMALRAKDRIMASPLRPAGRAAARAAAFVAPPVRRWLKMRPRWRAEAHEVQSALEQAGPRTPEIP